MYLYFSLLTALALPLFLNGQALFDTQSPLFKSSFLRDYPAVRQLLITQEHFSPVSFLSNDGYQLEGLFRQVNKPAATVVFVGGFLPGRLEGLATFVKLIPVNYNILFFHSRGRGQSAGYYSFIKVWHYGIHDYHDIIGALEFVCTKSDAPLFIHGSCAGAYHSARALIRLADIQPDRLKKLPLKGLIFDSGWSNPATIGFTALPAYIARAQGLKRFMGQLLLTCAKKLLLPTLRANNHLTSLQGQMHKIAVPVLFVHCVDDDFAPFYDAVKLSQETPYAQHWWLPTSKHTCHQLKQPARYGHILQEFFTRALEHVI